MMRKSKYYLIAFLSLCTISCNVLDIDSYDTLSEDEVFKNKEAISAYITRMYSQLPIEDFGMSSSGWSYDRKDDLLDYYTGYTVNQAPDDVIDRTSSQRINGSMGAQWWDYEAIRFVNEFIEKVDKYSSFHAPIDVDSWQSEARVIRAWYYFAMAKRYGGVPIITVAQDVVVGKEGYEELRVARSSEQETWDFIIDELGQVIEYGLPADNGSGRINRSVATVLRAQAALYAASIAKYNTPLTSIGSHIDSKTGKQVCGIPQTEAAKYYKIAFDAANKVIKGKRYQLATVKNGDDYAKLFMNASSYNEAILLKEFKYRFKQHYWGQWRIPIYGIGAGDAPTLDLVNLYAKLDGSSAALKVGDGGWVLNSLGEVARYSKPEKLFEGRDHRLSGTVYYPGSMLGATGTSEVFDIRRGIIKDGVIADSKGASIVHNGKRYNVRGKFGVGVNSERNEDETQSGFLLRKYINESTYNRVKNNPDVHPWIVMRYAEVLLIAAEAAAELSESGLSVDSYQVGVDALNTIRARAGLPSTPLTVSEVRQQWVCEFVCENVVFWCNKRWRTFHERDVVNGIANAPILTDNFKTKALHPYWDITSNEWLFKVVDGTMNAKNSFKINYYYNQIPTGQINTNPLIIQNYGY